MAGLGQTISTLILDRQVVARSSASLVAFRDSPPLKEVVGFGSNPGALRMWFFVPLDLPSGSPLVVVLHGCGQNAEGYDIGTGWSSLAQRLGFAVLFPEQAPTNNPKKCFNWFQPEDTRRGSGEALSIRQMVERMILSHGLDRRRIYVTGLSAGGAMASVMLATYPEVFAGGAIIAGLPYGSAINAQTAFAMMANPPDLPQSEWGDLVRKQTGHDGPWPRISVWHGSADQTVNPSNAIAIVRQWRSLHEIDPSAGGAAGIEGQQHRVWRNALGEAVIELVLIPGMGHGVPIAASGLPEESLGRPAPFMIDCGICSTLLIAKFWGLAIARSPQNGSKIRRYVFRRMVRRLSDGIARLLTPGQEIFFGPDHATPQTRIDWFSGDWRRIEGSAYHAHGETFYGEAPSHKGLGGAGRRTTSISGILWVTGDQQLVYERRLHLRACTNLFTTARFRVLVNGEMIEETAAVFEDHLDASWSVRKIDLSPYSGGRIVVTFEVSAYSILHFEAVAKAWIRGVRAESCAASRLVSAVEE